MSQALNQVIVLFVLCVTLKQSFAFLPHFLIGVYKHMEINVGIFSIQNTLILSYVFVFFYIYSSYLAFLICLPLPWNVETHRGWTLTGNKQVCVHSHSAVDCGWGLTTCFVSALTSPK